MMLWLIDDEIKNRVRHWNWQRVRCFCIWRKSFSMGVALSATISRLLSRVAAVDHYVKIFMVFLARVFPSRELPSQNLLGYDVCIWVGLCGSILSLLPHHAQDFDYCINIQNLLEETHFGPALFSLAIWHLEKLNAVAKECLRWFHYEFWNEVIRDVSTYRCYGQEPGRSNLVCGADFTTWTMAKVFEELERVRQRSVVFR